MRNCEKCGFGLQDGATFCTNCGTAVPQQPAPPQEAAPQQPYQTYQQPYQQPVAPQQPAYYQQPAPALYPSDPEAEKSATACFVLGLLSFLLSCTGPIALILGIIGLTKFKKGKTSSKSTLATVGLVLGILGTISAAFLTVYWVLIIALGATGVLPAGFSSYYSQFGGDFPYNFN